MRRFIRGPRVAAAVFAVSTLAFFATTVGVSAAATPAVHPAVTPSTASLVSHLGGAVVVHRPTAAKPAQKPKSTPAHHNSKPDKDKRAPARSHQVGKITITSSCGDDADDCPAFVTSCSDRERATDSEDHQGGGDHSQPCAPEEQPQPEEASTTTTTPQNQLPFTGMNVLGVAGLGLLLSGGGLVLRRRLAQKQL